MLTSIEKVMGSFDARCIAADLLPPHADDQKFAEKIMIGDWMPGPGTVDTSQPEGWSWQRGIVIWAPLDRPGTWFAGHHQNVEPWYARTRHIVRQARFCVTVDAVLAIRFATDERRVTVWAGADGRVIDAAIDLFAGRVRLAQQSARNEVSRLSRLGIAAGFVDRPPRTPLGERLDALAAALAGTPDAEDASRIADEWDGVSKPEGRMKKLKRMAQKHGVWRAELGL